MFSEVCFSFMLYGCCTFAAICLISINTSKCTSVFVKRFLLVVQFVFRVLVVDQLLLGESNSHKDIIFKSPEPWTRNITDNVTNCVFESDLCLFARSALVHLVLALMFGLSFVYRVASTFGYICCNSVFEWVALLLYLV